MNIELVNIDNLTKAEQDAFKRLLKKLTCKSGVFKPKENQNYYFVTGDGLVECQDWRDDCYDDTNYELGNCFETEEQAEFAYKKQEVYMWLKRYALEHNEKRIDFADNKQSKWCICLEIETDCCLSVVECFNWFDIKQVYFTSKEIAENAIAEIGEEKIKKYLFEVEE